MKNIETGNWNRNGVLALVGAFAVFASLSSNAADQIYGIQYPAQGGGQDAIVRFASDAPGTILESHFITGAGGNTMLGLDYLNGTLYGVAGNSQLYTINPSTGAATPVGSGLGVSLNGAAFGLDGSPSGIRMVSDLDQNLLINPATGVATAGTSLTPVVLNITALAWNGTTYFAIDSFANTLGTLNAAAGTFATIGSLGIDVSRINGFDYSAASGVLYLASPELSSGNQSSLYTPNPANGQATLVGLIGLPNDNTLFRGLTVVPEPSSMALMALGGLGMLALVFRRGK